MEGVCGGGDATEHARTATVRCDEKQANNM